jgi:hypothetical protein
VAAGARARRGLERAAGGAAARSSRSAAAARVCVVRLPRAAYAALTRPSSRSSPARAAPSRQAVECAYTFLAIFYYGACPWESLGTQLLAAALLMVVILKEPLILLCLLLCAKGARSRAAAAAGPPRDDATRDAMRAGCCGSRPARLGLRAAAGARSLASHSAPARPGPSMCLLSRSDARSRARTAPLVPAVAQAGSLLATRSAWARTAR